MFDQSHLLHISLTRSKLILHFLALTTALNLGWEILQLPLYTVWSESMRGNPYPMPFLMQPEVFADKTFRKIERGTSYAVIPWQMAAVAKLLRVLPDAWLDAALVGRTRKPRGPGPA